MKGIDNVIIVIMSGTDGKWSINGPLCDMSMKQEYVICSKGSGLF